MILPAVLDNPVLVREMRSRMRGARAYWLLGTVLLLLAVVMFALYTTWWSSTRYVGGYAGGARIGVMFFGTLGSVMGFLVFFITPALTAGGISIEREQRTLDMLEMTRLSRGAIVVGKLLSAVTFIGLMMVTSLPLMSICFMLGGVSPGEVAQLYGWLFAGSFLMAALGLVWSSIAKSTAAAVVYTYATMFAPVFVMMVAGTSGVFSGRPAPALETLMYLFAFVAGLPVAQMGWSPSAAAVAALGGVHLFGLAVPAWLPPAMTFGLIAALLICLAAAHLEVYPERKGKLLRLLTMAAVLVPCTFLFSARLSAPSFGYATNLASSLPPPVLLLVPMAILLLLIPVFATGERVDARAPRLRRVCFVLDGTLLSGPAFLVTVALALIGLYVAVCAITGNLSSGLFGAGIPSVAAPPEGAFAMAVAIILAATLAYSLLGAAISRVVGSRWASMALLYAVMAGIVFLPPLSLVLAGNNGSGGSIGAPSLLVNLVYLNPLPAMAIATSSGVDLSSMSPWLAMRNVPYPEASLVALLLLTAVSALALWFLTMPGRRSAVPVEPARAAVGEHDDGA